MDLIALGGTARFAQSLARQGFLDCPGPRWITLWRGRKPSYQCNILYPMNIRKQPFPCCPQSCPQFFTLHYWRGCSQNVDSRGALSLNPCLRGVPPSGRMPQPVVKVASLGSRPSSPAPRFVPGLSHFVPRAWDSPKPYLLRFFGYLSHCPAVPRVPLNSARGRLTPCRAMKNARFLKMFVLRSPWIFVRPLPFLHSSSQYLDKKKMSFLCNMLQVVKPFPRKEGFYLQI